MSAQPPTLGVLLAGGQARRIGGGDKPLRTVAGRTILDRVIAIVKPQVDTLILNANGDPSRFATCGLPVVADTLEGSLGPLAGILTALDWCWANQPHIEWVLSVPSDCPFLPSDLVSCLHGAQVANGAQLAVATSGGQQHHAIGLWSVALRDDLRHAFLEDGVRRVSQWTARYPVAMVAWPDQPIDPFFNVNTGDDLAVASAIAVSES